MGISDSFKCKMSTGFWLQYNQLTDTILNVMTCLCQNFSENTHIHTLFWTKFNDLSPRFFWLVMCCKRINIIGHII